MGSRGLLNCDKFEDRIHQILDDRLPLTADELLMDHASYCAKCERLLKAYSCIGVSLKLLPITICDNLHHHGINRRGGVRHRAIAYRPIVITASMTALLVISLNLFQKLNDSTVGDSQYASISIATTTQTASSPPIATSDRDPDPVMIPRRRPVPDTSPFNPSFSVAHSIPTMALPGVPSWEDISGRLEPLEPVLTYSARIPAVHPVYCSLNATIGFLRRSFSKSSQESEPDLGFSIEPDWPTTA